MRVLLCAYHEAGYRALRTLIARGYDILVATHQSPPEMPSVTALARACGVPVIDSGSDSLAAATLRFAPDVLLSVYYRHILPPSLLTLPRLGAFNFHPSLLPRHRGCFSAPWAIIEGDAQTGVTCHAMTEQIDAGDIVDSEPIRIGHDETGMSLFYRLSDVAVSLLVRVLDRLEAERINPAPQRGVASYHPRRVPFDGIIDPRWSRERIDRFIRALLFPSYPPASLLIDQVRHPVRTLGQYDELICRLTHPKELTCSNKR